MESQDLADIVLKWPIKDVLNKDLFKDKVARIPDTFQSIHHYFQSYVTPLLEETRADMCSNIENLSQATTLKIEESKRQHKEEGFVYNIKVRPLKSSTPNSTSTSTSTVGRARPRQSHAGAVAPFKPRDALENSIKIVGPPLKSMVSSQNQTTVCTPQIKILDPPSIVGGKEPFIPERDDVFVLKETKPKVAYDLVKEPSSYNVAVVTSPNSTSTSTVDGKEPYIPERDDVFVLTETKPTVAYDLVKEPSSYNVAVVTYVTADQRGPSYYVRVKASKPIVLPQSDDNKRFLLAALVMNIKTNGRIWKSLCSDQTMHRNSNVIKDVLQPDSMVGGRCHFCSYRQDIHIVKGITLHKQLLSFGLNESQKDAVLTSLYARQCIGNHSVKLIWGPPGTGKTKTVSVLLWALLQMKCRTLTCAPTNVAVLEVASRLVKLVRESRPTSDYSLGDILLFGNKKRMNIDDDLQDVFLDHRVDRLEECFAPSSGGWNHHLISMIEFLEDSVHSYKLYLENEKKEGEEDSLNEKKEGEEDSLNEKKEGEEDSSHERKKGAEDSLNEKKEGEEDSLNKKEKGEEDLLTFPRFVQQRFSLETKALLECIRTLVTHLPATLLSVINYNLLTNLRHVLQTFESLLGKASIADKELEEVFAHSEELNSATSQPKGREDKSSTALLLYKIRSDCLRLLRSLRESLKIPEDLWEHSIREFCFKGATLILCTVSTSFRLHSVEMDPLEMLVIDEASQLKECESTIPLQLLGIRRAILIGDECQLSAMVKSKLSESAGFGRSLFERLSSLGLGKDLLNMQYRMHPSISSFPNANFYKNKILDSPNVKHPDYKKQYLPGRMYGSYSFINVAEGMEVKDRHSPKNVVEIAVVLQLVRRLFEASLSSKQKLDVGVACPYSAQVSEIQEKLGKTYETHSDFTVIVKSIDGFQGGEKDVIIISTVRSNSKGQVGFLSNPQRTNVALTRARHCLWIVGNGLTLSSSGCVWKKVVLDAKNRGCYFNAEEDTQLAEAIISAVIEIGQFNHLLDSNSLLFNRAKWKVEFTDNFRISFAKIMKTGIRKEVIELIMKLSSGWRPKKKDVVRGCSFQLLNQFGLNGQYVIWAVDILKEDSHCIQVLKIWDIVPLAEIPNLVVRSNALIGMYTEDHKLKCRYKCIEGELVVPMTWKTTLDVALQKNRNMSIEDLSSDLNSLKLGTDHSASTSQPRELIVPMTWKTTPDTALPKNRNISNENLSSHLNSLKLGKDHSATTSQPRELVVPMTWKTTQDAALPKNRNISIEDLSSHINSPKLGASTSQPRKGREWKLSSLSSGQNLCAVAFCTFLLVTYWQLGMKQKA